jgi:hypothetical protein
MINWLKRLVVLSVVLSAFVGVAAVGALPAGATRAPHITTAHYTAHANSATLATVKIRTKSGKAVYSPTKVSGPSEATCSATTYAFLIINNTKSDQTVTYRGAALGAAIPPKDGLYICATGAITATFHLKSNKKAVLHVTIT